MSEPVKIFLSYSHQDEDLRNELVKHLGGLRRRGLIDIWHDRKILAGTEWAEQIDKNLEQAHIVLFLVSADFIDSQYCFDIEMTRALERHNGKTAHVIPVIVRDCDWHHAPFAKLQAVPTDGKAVTTWGSDRYAQDRAWTVVAKEIGKIAQQILTELQVAQTAPVESQPEEVKPQPPAPMIETLPQPEKATAKIFKFDVVTVDETGKEIARRPEQATYFEADLGNGVALEMVEIPGGTFQMGSEENESEQPIHSVTIAPFWMGKYAVTQAQYEAVMGKNPSHFKGPNRPVEKVSWHSAVEFCQRLSDQTGQAYRLPSEAEWEYACRAGTTTPFHVGATLTGNLANYDCTQTYAKEPQGKYRQETTEVGLFLPNGFGLYDMHGNVWEWCADDWYATYENAPPDGSARVSKSKVKPLRGGSWAYYPGFCRSAYRFGYDPVNRDDLIGFRVACSAPRTF